MYKDTDFNPDRERDEQAVAEQEALKRTIRREVLRMESGEAAAELQAEREEMAAERAEREADEARVRRRESSL